MGGIVTEGSLARRTSLTSVVLTHFGMLLGTLLFTGARQMTFPSGMVITIESAEVFVVSPESMDDSSSCPVFPLSYAYSATADIPC